MPQAVIKLSRDLSRLLRSPWFSLLGYLMIATGNHIVSFFSQVEDTAKMKIVDWIIFAGGCMAMIGTTYKTWTSDVYKQLETSQNNEVPSSNLNP